jgi:hypothetical protein
MNEADGKQCRHFDQGPTAASLRRSRHGENEAADGGAADSEAGHGKGLEDGEKVRPKSEHRDEMAVATAGREEGS